MVVKLNRVVGRPYHPGIVPVSPNIGEEPGGTPARSLLSQATQEIAAQGRAVAESLVHRGRDEVVDLVGTLSDPVAGVVYSLVSFTVPSGMVLSLNKIAVTYSNPQVAVSNIVGWRLIVDNAVVSNVGEYTSNRAIYYSMGDLNMPVELHPVWVQSREVVSIEVTVADPLFDEHLVMWGRLGGRVYKPAAGVLGGVL
jgi:hypothetical protein